LSFISFERADLTLLGSSISNVCDRSTGRRRVLLPEFSYSRAAILPIRALGKI